MIKNSKHEAAIPNPALNPFDILIGEWKTIGTHPYFPDITFHGHTSFKWIEGGAFMIMHSEIDEAGIPSGIAIFGSDASTGEYFMLYFDERKVSRKYEVSFHDNILKWWRNAPPGVTTTVHSHPSQIIYSAHGGTMLVEYEDGKRDVTLTTEQSAQGFPELSHKSTNIGKAALEFIPVEISR